MRFSDIPGNEDAKARLRAMADSDRIPHAILLEGPPGIGKLSIARAFVQYVHCTARSPLGEPCGRCRACRQMESFNHIDTLYSFPVVKTDSSRPPISDDFIEEWKTFLREDPYADSDRWSLAFGKANVRPVIYASESADIIHKLTFQSHESSYKALILWLPERMNEETANKLLKMVEEPYPGTMIVMVSDSPGEILPTIYSRMQRLRLGPLTQEQIAAELVRLDGATAPEAHAAALLAAGTMKGARAALSMTQERRAMFDSFKQLMRLAYTRDVSALKGWASDLAATGREQQMKFYEYAQHLAHANFIHNFHLPQLGMLAGEEESFARNFARFITTANVEEIVRVFNDALTDIARNANAKIVNFDVAVKLIILIRRSS